MYSMTKICFLNSCKYILTPQMYEHVNEHNMGTLTKHIYCTRCIFVAIANNTLYGSKLYIFILCQKIIRILRSCSMKIFCTFKISKLIFLLINMHC